MTDWTVPEICCCLNQHIADVVSYLGLNGNRNGDSLWVRNPCRNDHNPSLQIRLGGQAVGKWKDQGIDIKGDALELLQYVLNTTKAEAIKIAKGIIGLNDADSNVALIKPVIHEFTSVDPWIQLDEFINSKEYNQIKQTFFVEAQEDVVHSPVYSYLNGRGIDLKKLKRIPASLRFGPQVYCSATKTKLPAMLWLFRRWDGQFCGLHITYLDQVDGKWVKYTRDGVKAKIIRGKMACCFIPLARGRTGKSLSENDHGDSVLICEGIETGLSIALAHPDERVIAAGSVSNIKNVRLPNDIRNVCLCMDNDGIDAGTVSVYETAASEFEKQGRSVFKMLPENGHKDFNDWLQYEENTDAIPF